MKYQAEIETLQRLFKDNAIYVGANGDHILFGLEESYNKKLFRVLEIVNGYDRVMIGIPTLISNFQFIELINKIKNYEEDK